MITPMTKISMEEYVKRFYDISKEFTQGCILPLNPSFNITTTGLYSEKPKAILIIENACNLVEEVKLGRMCVETIEYIILYDATTFLESCPNCNIMRDFIQNRRFETEFVYLPPHLKYTMHPDGFYGICSNSAFIPLTRIKENKQEEYLCVKPPFRDYIKNKYVYFKIMIPLKQITDDESYEWIFRRELMKGDKTPEELKSKLKSKKMKLDEYDNIVKNLVDNGILSKNETGNYTID